MKVIILAAGYATRLYPLTLNQPKPLLSVAGKPMIEHVLDNLSPIGGIDRIYIVTNAKFAGHFQKWSERHPAAKSNLEFTVVNDGTTSEANKLGAIGDIHHVLQTQKVHDDLIVVAGDNLFSEKLGDFGNFCREKSAPVLALYDVGNLEEIKKYSSISVATDGRITAFEEKPKHPTSTMAGIALYYYPQDNHSAHQTVCLRRQQPRSTRPAGAMALPAHAGLYLARAGALVRHRLEGNSGGSEQDFFRASRRGEIKFFRSSRRKEALTE